MQMVFGESYSVVVLLCVSSLLLPRRNSEGRDWERYFALEYFWRGKPVTPNLAKSQRLL
jgi:hypothetical protein